jgi:GTP-binding nuclear protein Ran
MSIFKILIVGDQGVGKSTFIARHRNGDYAEQGETLGIDVTPLHFNTTRGNITLNVWDMGRSTDHMVEPFHGVHGVIVMFDVTRRETYDHVDEWYAKI